jgi:isoleucyl-tRNA synthetase
MSHILSHGFVVDSNGHKMSKSLGNGIEPRLLIEGWNKHAAAETSSAAAGDKKAKKPPHELYAKFGNGVGTDGARLWACSVDFTRDAVLSTTVVTTALDLLKKWRGTARFIIGSMVHHTKDIHNPDNSRKVQWSPLDSSCLVAYEDLSHLDHYLLSQLHALETQVTAAYDSHAVYKGLGMITAFINSTLSAQYLDIVKDRLYCTTANDPTRLASLTTMCYTLEAVTKLMAPIIPHATQELYMHLPADVRAFMAYGPGAKAEDAPASVFGAGWVESDAAWERVDVDREWDNVLSVRSAVNRTIERSKQHNIAVKAKVKQIASSGVAIDAAELIEAPVVKVNSEADIIVLVKDHTVHTELLLDALNKCGLRETLGVSTCVVQYAPSASISSEATLPVMSQEHFELFTADEKTYASLECTLSITDAAGKEAPVRVKVLLGKTDGSKCPRCWRHSTEEGYAGKIAEQLVGAAESDVVADAIQEVSEMPLVSSTEFVAQGVTKEDYCLCARCTEVLQM